jgi:uncharacterized protein HemX
MSAKPLKSIAMLALAAGVAVWSAGCSSNPPCETDLAAVDAARSSAKAADAKMQEAKSQKDQLERQLAAEKARKAELEKQKAELEKQIAELGGK